MLIYCTKSGKTAVFEMCLARLFQQRKSDEQVKAGKILQSTTSIHSETKNPNYDPVYLAPSKFLVHQKMQVLMIVFKAKGCF